jgi:hypothetical protein
VTRRKSRRELEAAIDALCADAGGGQWAGERPELTPDEKEALAELFDVDPWRETPPAKRRALDDVLGSTTDGAGSPAGAE